MNKSKILIFIDWYVPAYKAGGPVKSIFNLIQFLKNNYNFYVVTSDRDLGDSSPFTSVLIDQWNYNDETNIIYLSPKKQKIKVYKQIIKSIKPDIIYINGIFSLNFSIKPLFVSKQFNIKTIIAPRGMLGGGALSIKPFKKKLFLLMAKTLGWYNSIIWHATDITEKNEILLNISEKALIKIIPNVSQLSSTQNILLKQKEKNKLKLIYLSRISIKKNLLFLLEIINEDRTLNNILLDIYGPIEDKSYFDKCNYLINQINTKTENKIEYNNSLQWHEIKEYLPKYHFFILPTLHENFGHAIFEAFALGVPVVISNNTPWRNLNQQNVGWDIPLIKKQWNDVLHTALQMDNFTYIKYAKSCINFADKWVKKQSFKEKYTALFKNTFHEE